MLSYTPSDSDAGVRRHRWSLVWQPVGEGVEAGDWMALAPGEYRFVITGDSLMAQGGSVTPYRIELDPFSVVPTSIEVSEGEVGVRLRYVATARGHRHRGVNSDRHAAAPLLEGQALVLSCLRNGEETLRQELNLGPEGQFLGALPGDGSRCTLTDVYGNSGPVF